jgi:uncharacterized repeat protein (TIGR03803 family)
MLQTIGGTVQAQRSANYRAALACMLLIAFAAAPLHAQFTYWDWYDFNCNSGLPCEPNDIAELSQGLDGNLYGTTLFGGAHNFGTIFMMTPTGGYTNLWDFDGVTGEYPTGGLTLASDGNFYGIAPWGGTFNFGTLFRFTPPNSVTVLHDFTGGLDGWNPNAPPVQGPDGNLYGMTFSGNGYSITLTNGSFTSLSQGEPNGVYAPLYLASDGNFYGASSLGGTYNLGTLFRMTPNGSIEVLYNFSGGTDGSKPVSPVVQFSNGYLYGTTLETNIGNPGVVFRLTLSGKIQTVHTFSPLGSGSTNADGASPQAGLLVASDGYMYGVTSAGGAYGFGTIYQYKPGAAFTKLFDLSAVPGALLGFNYATNLTQHTNGSFYGVTSELGSEGGGNFYALTAPSLSQILKVAGPIFVLPGGPVEIRGNNLTQVSNINFGAVAASFRIGSDTQLLATVPFAAVDAAISAIYVTGLQVQTVSAVHILPLITAIDPLSGPVGTVVTVSGGGFNGATKVTFGGVNATSFTVMSPTTIQATVPSGFTKGKVTVKTRNGKSTSTQRFVVQ